MNYKRVIISILVTIVLISIVFVIAYPKEKNLFIKRVKTISSVTVFQYPTQKKLTSEQVEKFKQLIMNRYKQNMFTETSTAFFDLSFKVKFLNETYGIGYLVQSKQLVFQPFWFVPENRNDLLHQAKEISIDVDEEIVNLLKELGLSDQIISVFE